MGANDTFFVSFYSSSGGGISQSIDDFLLVDLIPDSLVFNPSRGAGEGTAVFSIYPPSSDPDSISFSWNQVNSTLPKNIYLTEPNGVRGAVDPLNPDGGAYYLDLATGNIIQDEPRIFDFVNSQISPSVTQSEISQYNSSWLSWYNTVINSSINGITHNIEGGNSYYIGINNSYTVSQLETIIPAITNNAKTIVFGTEYDDTFTITATDQKIDLYLEGGNDTVRLTADALAGAIFAGEGENDADTLILSGEASDYQFIDIIGPDLGLGFAAAQINVFNTKNDTSFLINGFENIVFDNSSFDNVVKMQTSSGFGDFFALGMAHLARDAYVDRYASFGDGVVQQLATSDGWELLTGSELGLSVDGPNNDANGRYTFVNGEFRSSEFAYGEAVAHVYKGVHNGKQAIAVAFRGTADPSGADWITNLNATAGAYEEYFKNYAPLVTALKQFIGAGGVENIYVTGHSLGGAMAQRFMQEFPGNGSVYGVTFGAPGFPGAASASDNRLIQIEHVDDFVPWADDISALGIDALAPFLALGSGLGSVASVIQALTTQLETSGQEVVIRRDNSLVDGNVIEARLYNHDIDIYVDSVEQVIRDTGIPPSWMNKGPHGTISDEAINYIDPDFVNPPVDVAGGIYRFFNQSTGSHFYTASAEERDSLYAGTTNFSYDGASFKSASVVSDSSPVFRFYNKVSDSHFYTNSEAERDQIIANLPDLVFEGAAYDAYSEAGEGREELYRFYNTETGSHFYTASEEERDIVKTLQGYDYEGVAYWVNPV